MAVEVGMRPAASTPGQDDTVLVRLLGDGARRSLVDGAPFLARDRDRLDDVFTPADVEEIVAAGRPGPATVEITRDGAPVDPARWTSSGARTPDRELDARSVDDLMESGAALILRGLRRRLGAVDAFGHRLAGELGRTIEAEATVAVAGLGRVVRADEAGPDCFVCQVSGSATWTLGDEGRRWMLGPGDVLYVPYGWSRRSETVSDAPSVDLLFCVTGTVTWKDALERVVRESAVGERWRKILPVRPDERIDEVAAELTLHRDVVVQMLEDLDVGTAAAGLAAAMSEAEPDRRVPALHGLGNGDTSSAREVS